MRNFILLIASAGILAGAYFVAFGVPQSLDIDSSSAPDASSNAASNSKPSNGPGNRLRKTTVITAPLELRRHTGLVSAIGTAKALHSVDIIPDTAGTVIETHLTPNSTVQQGDVLIKLDARSAELNLEIAKAELDRTQDTVKRYERLRSNGSTTITDVALSEAKIEYRLAKAAMELVQITLDDHVIRAPISGRLSLSDVEIGDILTTNSIIATVDDTEQLLIEFELPERAIGLLKETDEILAHTSTYTGRIFKGTIASHDSRIDDKTRSVTVKAVIENPDHSLWPGMTFSVRLEQESEPFPVVPQTAITWSRAGSSIWIDSKGLAEQIPVTILYRQNEIAWVQADLPEGTMIVTEGAHKLRPGSLLDTQTSDAAPQPRLSNTEAANPAEDKS